MQYLSVADNERDAVFLHVSASSEREEWRNETDAMTKTRERHILNHSNACGPSGLCCYVIVQLLVKVTKHITPHVKNIIVHSHFSC